MTTISILILNCVSENDKYQEHFTLELDTNLDSFVLGIVVSLKQSLGVFCGCTIDLPVVSCQPLRNTLSCKYF